MLFPGFHYVLRDASFNPSDLSILHKTRAKVIIAHLLRPFFWAAISMHVLSFKDVT